MNLYNYLCGNVPGGISLLIVFLVVGWFIIWFVYHYTSLMDRRHLYRWMFAVTLLSIFIYGALWIFWKPPPRKKRIAIVPQNGYSTGKVHWRDYAFQFLVYYNLIKQLPDQQWFVYPPEGLYRVANQKIFSDSKAQIDFFKRLNCDYVVYFTIDSLHRQLNGQILVFPKADLVFRFQFQFNSLTNAASKLSQQLCQQLHSLRTEQNTPAAVLDDDFWRTYTLGQFAFFKGDTLTSEKYFRRCCQRWPQAVWGYCALAHLYLRKAVAKKALGGDVNADLGEIAALLLQAKRLSPNLAWVYCLYGEYFIQRENWYQAERCLKQCLRLNRNNVGCYLALSRLHPSRYRDLGFLHEEALLKYAIFLDPTCIAAYLWLADYYCQKNQLDDAISQYQQLLALNPDNVNALIGLGKLYLQNRNFAQMQMLFRHVLEIAPANTQALYNLGVGYYTQGELDSAADYFTRALKTPHVNPDAYLYLAYIHEKKGDLAQAVSFLRLRIHYSHGANDSFCEEARRHLVKLLQKHPELLNIK